MRTPAAEMLDVEYPILAFSHCRDVVAAVTNAGGFGVLGAVAHTPEQLEIDLTWIENEVCGRPYGLDLLLPQKYEGADQGGLDRDALRSSTTSSLATRSPTSTLPAEKRCRGSAG